MGKVSRFVAIYNEMDKERFLAEYIKSPTNSKSQAEIEQKILSSMRILNRNYMCRLRYLLNSIKTRIADYKKTESSPSPVRVNSYTRLLNHAINLDRFADVNSAEARFYKLAGILLSELDLTEKHHNGYTISYFMTKSTLAECYMDIFKDNGINPSDKRVIANAKNYNFEETPSALVQLFFKKSKHHVVDAKNFNKSVLTLDKTST